METGAYRPSRHHQILVWGGGMLVVGVGVFSILIVLLAIGAFDQWHIQSDGQITLVLSVPIFIVAVGLVLIIIGLVKGFSARK